MLRLFHICSLILLTKQARNVFKNRYIQTNVTNIGQCENAGADVNEGKDDNKRIATKSQVDECTASIETRPSIETSRADERIRKAEVMEKSCMTGHPTNKQKKPDSVDRHAISNQNNECSCILLEQNSPRTSFSIKHTIPFSDTGMASDSKKIRSGANGVIVSSGIIRYVGATKKKIGVDANLGHDLRPGNLGQDLKGAAKTSNRLYNTRDLIKKNDNLLNLNPGPNTSYNRFDLTEEEDEMPLDLSTRSYCVTSKANTDKINRSTRVKAATDSMTSNTSIQDKNKRIESTNDATKAQNELCSTSESYLKEPGVIDRTWRKSNPTREKYDFKDIDDIISFYNAKVKRMMTKNERNFKSYDVLTFF